MSSSEQQHGAVPTHTGGQQGRPDPLQAFLRSQPKVARELFAGGMAGALAKTCVAPLERAKILFQTRRLGTLGIPGILMHVWRTEGSIGLFRGNSASVLRIVPYAAIHFSAYEQYRRFLVSHVVDAGSTDAAAAAGHGSSGSHDSQALHPIWDLVAGSAAGGTAVILTYPLDLVRTRMAWATDPIGTPGGSTPGASGSRPHSTSSSATATVPPAAGAHTNQGHSAAGTDSSSSSAHKHSGACSSTGLSRRAVVAAGEAVSGHGGSSSWLGHTRHGTVQPGVACTLHSSSGEPSPSATQRQLHNGRLAGSAVDALARQRPFSSTAVKSAAHMPHPGLRALLQDTFRQEGVVGLYKGMSPTLMGILPYAGLKFYVYQSLKGWYKGRMQQQQQQQGSGAQQAGSTQDVSVQVRLVFGGVAGLVSQTLTYPLDVIRRRMQVEGFMPTANTQDGSSSSSSRQGGRGSSTWSTARSIIREEGARGLIRGLAINNIKVIPSTAIGFTVYDYLKQYMDVKGNL